MKIGLLISEPGHYSHKRLKEAAEARGHDFRIINLTECFVKISSVNPQIHYRSGEDLKDFDAVIPRIETSITFFGTAVLRQFEMLGVYPLNNSMSVLRARDKLRSLQIMAKYNLPMPVSGFAHSPQDTLDVINSVGGSPLIVKLVEGTEGVGVVLAETTSADTSVINAFKQLNANILVQEYIKESAGSDIRCFVIGGKIVASMKRIAKEGEFRANYHLGGSLIQHLPDRLKSSKINHIDPNIKFFSKTKKKEWEKDFSNHIINGTPSNIYPATHEMQVLPDSLLGKIYKKLDKNIDLHAIGELSIHHQGCLKENLGKGLIPIAFAPDGVIEAAELKNHPMCLITQFHLECNVSNIAKAVIENLIKVSRALSN